MRGGKAHRAQVPDERKLREAKSAHPKVSKRKNVISHPRRSAPPAKQQKKKPLRKLQRPMKPACHRLMLIRIAQARERKAERTHQTNTGPLDTPARRAAPSLSVSSWLPRGTRSAGRVYRLRARRCSSSGRGDRRRRRSQTLITNHSMSPRNQAADCRHESSLPT